MPHNCVPSQPVLIAYRCIGIPTVGLPPLPATFTSWHPDPEHIAVTRHLPHVAAPICVVHSLRGLIVPHTWLHILPCSYILRSCCLYLPPRLRYSVTRLGTLYVCCDLYRYVALPHAEHTTRCCYERCAVHVALLHVAAAGVTHVAQRCVGPHLFTPALVMVWLPATRRYHMRAGYYRCVLAVYFVPDTFLPAPACLLPPGPLFPTDLQFLPDD